MVTTHENVQQIGELVRRQYEHFDRLLTEIRRVIVGQDELLRKMLVGLLADGHILLEGVPGLAKTTAVACLASSSRRGSVRTRAKITEDVPPGTIFLAFHWREAPANILTQDFALDPVAKIPEYKVCAVKIENPRKPVKVKEPA